MAQLSRIGLLLSSCESAAARRGRRQPQCLPSMTEASPLPGRPLRFRPSADWSGVAPPVCVRCRESHQAGDAHSVPGLGGDGGEAAGQARQAHRRRGAPRVAGPGRRVRTRQGLSSPLTAGGESPLTRVCTSAGAVARCAAKRLAESFCAMGSGCGRPGSRRRFRPGLLCRRAQCNNKVTDLLLLRAGWTRSRPGS